MNEKFKEIVKSKLSEMIDNEGVIFKDGYGRRWKFEKKDFRFSDIGENEFDHPLRCVHLLDTAIRT